MFYFKNLISGGTTTQGRLCAVKEIKNHWGYSFCRKAVESPVLIQKIGIGVEEICIDCFTEMQVEIEKAAANVQNHLKGKIS